MHDPSQPGETWLIAAATGAALINVIPALAVGLAEIDRVLVLRGIDPTGAGPSAGIEADRGQTNMLAALAHELRRIGANRSFGTPPQLIEDMNDPWPWGMAIQEFFGASGAGRGARRIIYVYSGGTIDMRLGVWDALKSLRQKRPEITVEFVTKQERRVFWPMQQRAIDLKGGNNHVSIDGYLLAHGYRILNDRQSAERERFAATHAVAVGELADTLIARPEAVSQQWMTLLNRLSSASDVRVAEIARKSNLAVQVGDFCRSLASPVASYTDGRCSLQLRNGHWTFQRSDDGLVQLLLQGNWLEDWLFLRLRDALVGTPAVVRLGLEIQRLTAPADQRNDFEIDFAILANDQLYVAEAKTFLKDARPAINRLVALRRAVVGPPRIGKAWLICGEKVSDEAARREIAEHNDVAFVAGATEIESMLDTLRELVA